LTRGQASNEPALRQHSPAANQAIDEQLSRLVHGNHVANAELKRQGAMFERSPAGSLQPTQVLRLKLPTDGDLVAAVANPDPNTGHALVSCKFKSGRRRRALCQESAHSARTTADSSVRFAILRRA
jgi:hypothetical protein